METKYNGELRQLYNDIDKRVTTLERINTLQWETHDRGAKEREKYIHESFSKVDITLDIMNKKLDRLPCEVRTEHTLQREQWVDGNIKAIWLMVTGIVMGVLSMAWRILFSK